MPANSKQSNNGCSSSTMGGCGCLMFVVFGFLLLTALFGTTPAPASVFVICVSGTLTGLGLLIAGVKGEIAKKSHEQEYAKLLAEFKQDGMNEAAYERIVQFLSRVKQGTFKLDVYPSRLKIPSCPARCC